MEQQVWFGLVWLTLLVLILPDIVLLQGTSLSDWNYAYEIGQQPMSPWNTRPRIASNASWIWDSSETWNTGKVQRVSCQKILGNS